MTIPFVLEKFKIAFAILGCYVYMFVYPTIASPYTVNIYNLL